MRKKIPKKQLQKLYEDFLEQQHYYSENTIKSKRWHFSKLIDFMQSNGYKAYTPSVGMKFLDMIIASKNRPMQFSFSNTIYQIEKLLKWRSSKPNCFEDNIYTFDGELGHLAKCYIEEQTKLRRWAYGTKRLYMKSLSRFVSAINLKKIKLRDLNASHLMSFISSRNNLYKSVYGPVRKFIKHLYENGLIKSDLSHVLYGIKDTAHVKLPSYYSADEIKAMLSTIDRTSPTGKRDYCMALLASRLGLRSSDVVSLRFADIDWERNTINLTQCKTKRIVTLPLLNDVGEALIDYIQFGRRKSDSQYVFIATMGVDKPLNSSSFSKMVRTAFNKAGINTDGRKSGAHSLRHSYATMLLNANTSITIISDALGHKDGQTAIMYLGINVNQLIDCSLVVPHVTEDFYTQKDGFFYE